MNVLETNEKKNSFSKEIDLKKNQMEISELKNIIAEIKAQRMGSTTILMIKYVRWNKVVLK